MLYYALIDPDTYAYGPLRALASAIKRHKHLSEFPLHLLKTLPDPLPFADDDLGGFTGTEAYHPFMTPHASLVLTDGARCLLEQGGDAALYHEIARLVTMHCADDRFLCVQLEPGHEHATVPAPEVSTSPSAPGTSGQGRALYGDGNNHLYETAQHHTRLQHEITLYCIWEAAFNAWVLMLSREY